MENTFIYMDHAATTKVSDSVYEAMLPFLKEQYGNPSSIYSIAHEAKFAVDRARKQAAEAIGACEDSKKGVHELFFTSCGTEADNWAIFSAAQMGALQGKKHIITTNIEHHAVLHCCQALEKQGFEVTYLPVDEQGLISSQQVLNALRDDTALVTVMYANNEIGTIQPISEIGSICRERGVLFHTDAVQAVGNLPIDVQKDQVDLLSLSGHKIHAPKGVGALFIRRGIRLPNLLYGGGQEYGKRGGTENVAFMVALGQALADAAAGVERKQRYLTPLRDQMIDFVCSEIPKTRLNGDRKRRLCSNVNFSFEGIEGESILLMLDGFGIAASSGSACTSGSLDPSHVLLAIGLPHEIAHGSLRLTLGEENTPQEVQQVLQTLPQIICRLRELSPVWHEA